MRPGLQGAAPNRLAVMAAVERLADGGMVVVVDDAARENEGDLVIAAEHVTAEAVAFMVRHSTGILCAPMTGVRLDELQLPLMVNENTEAHHTAFTISVDARSTSTGVSAADRANTLRALANPKTTFDELRRPGHIFPLRYCEGGVLKRAGHTEAAIDLLKLAGAEPVAVIGELVNDDGSMSRPDRLHEFATEHDLPIVALADLIRYRRMSERLVTRFASAAMPTSFGEFQAVAYRSVLDDVEHLVLIMGDPKDWAETDVLVRVHSECLTGDILGSLRCDCGSQLESALIAIAEEGRGVVVYLRGQEGRGIGLGHKLRAYALQEQGRDTVDANTDLGLPVDSREYGIGAQILADLGVRRIRLMTNNPAKYGGLEGYDLEIAERVGLPTLVTAQNVRYLRTKRDRLAHEIQLSSHVVSATP